MNIRNARTAILLGFYGVGMFAAGASWAFRKSLQMMKEESAAHRARLLASRGGDYHIYSGNN